MSQPNHGILHAEVWPVYVGLAETESASSNVLVREPIGDTDYERGTISWETNKVDKSILGRGVVGAPKGIYTHIVFATAPVDSVCGIEKLEHPIIFDRAGWVHIDPIRNKNYLPRDAK